MAGCAALIKPSEVTPRFIPELRKTIEAVPELAKVLAIVDHVDYVCFTGSVATGRKVAEAAARAFIPANLELGGKDPMIILPSADPEVAASIALRASVAANGQACQSIERIHVARSRSPSRSSHRSPPRQTPAGRHGVDQYARHVRRLAPHWRHEAIGLGPRFGRRCAQQLSGDQDGLRRGLSADAVVGEWAILQAQLVCSAKTYQSG